MIIISISNDSVCYRIWLKWFLHRDRIIEYQRPYFCKFRPRGLYPAKRSMTQYKLHQSHLFLTKTSALNISALLCHRWFCLIKAALPKICKKSIFVIYNLTKYLNINVLHHCLFQTLMILVIYLDKLSAKLVIYPIFV